VVVSAHLSKTSQTCYRSPLRDSRHRADHGTANKILVQLRKDLNELHCLQKSAAADIAEIQEDELPFDTVLGITTMAEGLETRASLGPFSVWYEDIIQKSCELGLDTRDVYDELDDECDEEKVDMARDVAAIALTSVHGLNIMD
jgi:hypothetical protein